MTPEEMAQAYKERRNDHIKMKARLKRECFELNQQGKSSETCAHLGELMAQGDALMTLHKAGRVINADNLIDSKNNSNVLYTDPHSEEYCLQSLDLNRFSLNTRILILRLKEITHLCLGYLKQDDYIADPEILKSFSLEGILKKLDYFLVRRYPDSPIYQVHDVMIKLIQLQLSLGEIASFTRASQDILGFIIDHQNLSANKTEIIKEITNIPVQYAVIACEKMRMEYADALLWSKINATDALLLVSNSAFRQVQNVVQTLLSMDIEKYSVYGFENSLDSFNTTQLQLVEYLTKVKHLELSTALDFVGYFNPAQLFNWADNPVLKLYNDSIDVINHCDASNAESIVEAISDSKLFIAPFMSVDRCLKIAEALEFNHRRLFGVFHDRFHKTDIKVENPNNTYLFFGVGFATLGLIFWILSYLLISRKLKQSDSLQVAPGSGLFSENNKPKSTKLIEIRIEDKLGKLNKPGKSGNPKFFSQLPKVNPLLQKARQNKARHSPSYTPPELATGIAKSKSKFKRFGAQS